MSSQDYYVKRIVSRTIGQRNLASLIRPSITPDLVPIIISTRKVDVFAKGALSSDQISLHDEELIRDSRKEDSELRRRGGVVRSRSNDVRPEVPEFGNVSKPRADNLSNVRQSRAQQERIEEESPDNNRREDVNTSNELSSSQRNSGGISNTSNRPASRPNLEGRLNVAPTKPSEDLDQSLIWARILRSLGLLSKRLDQVVSQSAGFSERLNRIEARTVMPSSYSDRLTRRAERQQQQLKLIPSPSLSLNDYLKKRAGESK